MSERHHHAPEHENEHKFTPEVEPLHEKQEHRQSGEHHKHSPEREPDVEEIERRVKHEAEPANKELTKAEKGPDDDSVLYVNRELKQETWNRTMTRVRKQLSAPQRVMSRIIHQPVVDTVSRAGAQTVARPSGLLGGGICALIGSSFFLIMARRFGFTYNYLIFFLFFIGGFAVGLILELIVFAFRRKKA